MQALDSERIARRVALASIFISGTLAAVKIGVGLAANSTAVLSDGFESGGDMLASGLVLLGLRIASRPPDREHPYGHGRFEILTGLLVGIILSATGAMICVHSLETLLRHRQIPRAFAIWPMLASLAIKAASWFAKRYWGRRIRSESLMADSWNDAVDIFSALTAVVALELTIRDPARFKAADAIGGFVVGVIVVFLGIHIARDTTLQLMDTMPPALLMAQIRTAAMSVEGALGVEKCFARKTGFKYHVDLHLEVDPTLTVRDSHNIAKKVKQAIRDQLDWVADVLVHVEPYGTRRTAG